MVPKNPQSDNLEALRIELDRNPGTDLLQTRRTELDRNIGTHSYQIPERILGDDYQNPITADTEETGKFDVDMPTSNQGYTQTAVQLKAMQTRTLKMKRNEKCWSHHCVYTGEGKIMIFLEDPWLQGNRKRKCTMYSS